MNGPKSVPPYSMTITELRPFSDSRAASAEPAEPEPTTTKSASFIDYSPRGKRLLSSQDMMTRFLAELSLALQRKLGREIVLDECNCALRVGRAIFQSAADIEAVD